MALSLLELVGGVVAAGVGGVVADGVGVVVLL